MGDIGRQRVMQNLRAVVLVEHLHRLGDVLEGDDGDEGRTARRQLLADHAAGNYRVLMNLSDELLTLALDRELPRLDEKLYLEAFAQPAQKKAAATPNRKR